ncbi:MAG: pyridoxal-phosphate dependent enzyme [Thermoproteales archaeon]|nr:pyridoxal-phosphate dependent enzyme [Thermoproteales archaeon]
MVELEKCLYRCVNCGWEKNLNTGFYAHCPKCKHILVISYEELETKNLKSTLPGIWRYSSFLPEFRVKPSLGEGGTPVRRGKKLEKKLGLAKLFLKDETKNPTGAFTDRGAALITAFSLHNSFQSITSITGGNIAASLATYCAAFGVEFTAIFRAPVDLEKLYMITACGGYVTSDPKNSRGFIVKPSNPFLVEGYKTISFEIHEYSKRLPDVIIAPVGHGSLTYALWKGFEELGEVGLITRKPFLVGVEVGKTRTAEDGATEEKKCSFISSELSVPQPAWRNALKEIVSKGEACLINVSDEEVVEGLRLLAAFEGLLVETASATAVSGLIKALNNGIIRENQSIMLVVTGSGLKNPRTFIRILEKRFIDTCENELNRPSRISIEILNMLSEGSLHGYKIWKKLYTKGYNITLQAVYYHLKRLEEIGLIRRIVTRPRKTYVITRDGLEFLKNIL